MESQEPDKSKEVADKATAKAKFEPLYTYADLAAHFRVGHQTIYEWVKRGRIPSPVYVGATARFTHAQYLMILKGPGPAGTFVPAESIRSEVGKKGGGNWRLPKGKRKKPTKKPTAKKPTAKKGGKKT